MFDLSKGAIVPGASLFILSNSGHIAIVSGQLILLSLSFVFLIATLMRFYINFKKCSHTFYNAETIPSGN